MRLVEAKVTTFQRGWQAAEREPFGGEAGASAGALTSIRLAATWSRENALLHCSINASRPVKDRHIEA
jgi:hypothetical protein